MTFRYGLTLPAVGGNKLARFSAWARESVPEIDYLLPPQAPIKSETLTIRLRSPEAAAQLRSAFPASLP